MVPEQPAPAEPYASAVPARPGPITVPIHNSAAPLPPPPDTSQWYLMGADGRQYGPASRQGLDVWFAEGRITVECQLLRGGAPQWLWASEVFPQLASPTGTSVATQQQAIIVNIQSPTHESGYSDEPYRPRKEAGIAALLSLLIPGAGQIYVGDVGIGIAMLIGIMVLWGIGAVFLPLLIVAFGLSIWSIFDAYKRAEAFNRRGQKRRGRRA